MAAPAGVEEGSRAPLKAVVVGGGPAGCLTAFFLAKRGFQVTVFERRSDVARPLESTGVIKEEAKTTIFDRSETRSYAMMLTKRAFVPLAAAGIELPGWIGQRILGSRRTMTNGKVLKNEYGPGTDNRTVARQALTAWLLYHLQDMFPDSAKVCLGYGFVGFKEGEQVALFEKSKRSTETPLKESQDVRSSITSEELLEAPFDLLVGADGVSSGVRSHLLKKEEAEGTPAGECELTCSQTTSLTLYKTLVVPGSVAAQHGFGEENRLYLNTWQCGIMMVPMGDGSLWGGSMEPRLVSASTPDTVTSIMSKEAPTLLPMLQDNNPGFAQQFVQQPAIPQGINTVLSRFHSGHVVLVGDAAHSMVPTLGQGCNTAIEDSMVLDQTLEAHGVRGDGSPERIPRALKDFTERRLPDARAIQALNAKRFFPRTSMDRVKFMSFMILYKVAPFLVGTPSFFMLFSNAPFRRILAQKDREDLTWRALQISAAVAGFGIASYAFRQLLAI